MKRNPTRREFLSASARIGVAGAVVAAVPWRGSLLRPAVAEAAEFFTAAQRRTLNAAVARIVPAETTLDWSAADLGAGRYIEGLLAAKFDDETPDPIYAGGPVRASFGEFQSLSRIKRIGWNAEIERLQGVYRNGLAELDYRAGGNFAALPAELQDAGGNFAALPAEQQDAILTSLDLEGDDTPAGRFFRALYDHTMEGVYGHPVYGGNLGFRAWEELCYAGDVHGVRFPTAGDTVSTGAWNEFGGYAPEEMVRPGDCPGPYPF